MGFEKIESARSSSKGYSARFKKTNTGGVLRISSAGVAEMAIKHITYNKDDAVDMFYDSETEMVAITKGGSLRVTSPSTKNKTLVINSKALADKIPREVVEYSMDFSNNDFDVVLVPIKPKEESIDNLL